MKSPLLLLIGFMCAGCVRDSRVPIVVYSPHGKEMLAEFEKQYEVLHPEHDVQWLDMGSQDAYDRIRTERGNPQADVWWGAPMTAFVQAEQESLLARYVPSWDSVVTDEFKSQQGYWYGTFVTPEVIMYNSRLLAAQEAPRDWDDLLDPKWKGRIIIRYPVASGTMRIIFCALIQREIDRGGDAEAGLYWLRRLDANTKTYAADPTQLYLKIAREEGAITLWDLPDVMIQVQTNGYPFGYVVPRSGTPLITDCIAIVRGARHPAEARQFYEFVTSRESMVLQARVYCRIPTRMDLNRSKLPPWMSGLTLTPLPVDWRALMRNEREWMRAWDERIKGTGKDLVTSP
jgi:iron(III) transport system substrate-binding protein